MTVSSLSGRVLIKGAHFIYIKYVWPDTLLKMPGFQR